MAEVRLRKDFYGTLTPKLSSDNLKIMVGFDYKGPAQMLDIETNTGKRGLWGDYDQESPTYHDSKLVSESETFRSYSFSRTIPLSFWSDRQIEDCAAEVVITGAGIHQDAVLWDAYTVNVGVAVEQKCAYIAPIQEGGHVESSPAPNSIEKAWFGELWCYDIGTRVDLTAIPDPGYKWVRWSFLSEVANRDINPTYMYMTEDRGSTARVIVAEFELVVPEPPTSDIRNFDFLAAKGTYKLGDTVPFTAPYEYKGKAQGGYLTISLGTGIYPSFFTKHTFPRIPVVFQEAMDWTRDDLEGQFVIPAAMEEGQTYSVRAKLETADGKQETDTDWSAFDIAAPPKAQLEIVSARFT